MDGGEEVACGFVVAGGDGAEEFKFGEEVFNQMARFVEFLVILALFFAVGFGRDDRRFARFLQGNQHPRIGIESLVGDHRFGFQLRQQNVGTIQLAGLAAGEMKPRRVAQIIDRGMNLGAQSALAAPDRLIGAPFLSAPALC